MTKRVSLADMDMSVVAAAAPAIERAPAARVEPHVVQAEPVMMAPVAAVRIQKKASERDDATSKGFKAVNWFVKPSTRDRLHDIAKLRRKYVYEVLDEVLGRFIEEEYGRTLRSMAAEADDVAGERRQRAAGA